MKLIKHYNETNGEASAHYMEEGGRAYARAYWSVGDERMFIYLDSLSVMTCIRKLGIGTQLQEIREEEGRSMGAKVARLWCTKGTWQHEWYKRRGYKDWQDHDTEPNAVWMEKEL